MDMILRFDGPLHDQVHDWSASEGNNETSPIFSTTDLDRPLHLSAEPDSMDDTVSWFLQIPPNPRRTSSANSNTTLSRLSSLLSNASSSRLASLFQRSSIRPSGPNDTPRHVPSRSASCRSTTHVETWRQPSRSVSWSAHVEVFVIPARERLPDGCDPRFKFNAMEDLPDDYSPPVSFSATDRAPDDCDPRMESFFDERSISFSCEDDTPWSARAARGGRSLDIENSLPL